MCERKREGARKRVNIFETKRKRERERDIERKKKPKKGNREITREIFYLFIHIHLVGFIPGFTFSMDRR